MNKYMISMIMSIKHTCTNLTTYTFKWLLKLYQSFITISDSETQIKVKVFTVNNLTSVTTRQILFFNV